jgi:hypothetical protein
MDHGETLVMTDLAYEIFRQFLLGPTPVFLSVGGGRTSRQNEFVGSLKELCFLRKIEAKTLDEYAPTDQQPLKDISNRMGRCYGAIVLAFERAHVEAGVWRGGVQDGAPMQDVRFPTVWNQIEAAMAYSRGLPLLVIAQDGLRREGLLESNYDWRVQWVNIDESVTENRSVVRVFDAWCESVRRKRDEPLRRS